MVFEVFCVAGRDSLSGKFYPLSCVLSFSLQTAFMDFLFFIFYFYFYFYFFIIFYFLFSDYECVFISQSPSHT